MKTKLEKLKTKREMLENEIALAEDNESTDDMGVPFTIKGSDKSFPMPDVETIKDLIQEKQKVDGEWDKISTYMGKIRMRKEQEDYTEWKVLQAKSSALSLGIQVAQNERKKIIKIIDKFVTKLDDKLTWEAGEDVSDRWVKNVIAKNIVELKAELGGEK